MNVRTGFPEYLESIAIGPDSNFLKTQTDLCDVANAFPQETELAYLWKKINGSTDPLTAAREFGKNFLLDAPDLSAEFIQHYVKKIELLPIAIREQIKYEISDAFDRAANINPSGNTARNFNNTLGINKDKNFLDLLADLMNSCKSACNYFKPISDKIGSIYDFGRMNSIHGATTHDTNLDAPPPIGIGLNILNKIPSNIQQTLSRAYTSAKLLVDAAKAQLTDPGTTKQLQQFAKAGISADRKGVPYVGSTGSSLFQDALGLHSSITAKVRRKLGDCFRLYDNSHKYNSFDKDMNLAQAQERVLGLRIKDAALGGSERMWNGTAQGVSAGYNNAVYQNNITPSEVLKYNSTGDAHQHDDVSVFSRSCPIGSTLGAPVSTASGVVRVDRIGLTWTAYGSTADPQKDSNSLKGIGNSNNKLEEGDIAIGAAKKQQLEESLGRKIAVGDLLNINGKVYRYADTNGNPYGIDVYSPTTDKYYSNAKIAYQYNKVSTYDNVAYAGNKPVQKITG